MLTNFRFVPNSVLTELAKHILNNRALVEAIPTVNAMLPLVQGVNDGLIGLPTAAAENPAVAQISQKQVVLDRSHDALHRAVHYAFEAHENYLRAQAVVDVTRVTELERVRKAIQPDGLAVTRGMYLAEAGNADRLQHLLASDAGIQTGLSAIRVGGVDGVAVVKQIIEAGTELGKLEAEKSKLGGVPTDPSLAKKTLKARNLWIQTMETFFDVLALANVSSDTMAVLRRPFDETVERMKAATKPKKVDAPAS